MSESVNTAKTLNSSEMNAPRKLAFIIYQAGAQADGGLNSITELVTELAPGNRLLVFTNREGRFTTAWRDAGCEVAVVPMRESQFHEGDGARGGRVGRFLGRLLTNWRIARRLRAESFDLLHANDNRSFWSGLFAARLTGTPIILNVRDALPPRYATAPLRWRLAYALCDRLLVLSRDMERYWRNLLNEKGAGKVSYLYSIVRPEVTVPDAAARRRERAALGLPDNAFVISYVASFHPKKRQAEFLEHAAGPILSQAPEIRIVFVGDCDPATNPAAARAVEVANQLDAGERIQFSGFTREPWRWYVASDLVLLASEREGLPRCLIESLCYGTPFASFAVSSAQELADLSGAGSVAPLGDYPALVEAVAERRQLAASDASLRDRRAAEARARFEATAAREGYLALLNSLTR
ncbi:glycosyltransferase [Caulobacter sp.]|uniref:glycosyltransferase n=1 Tax=Caulobacter sp. TaxID=78 RepID=UPI002B473C05|nr:glycosyltransferase [Caulobacter sp.]HJV42154.1 glycosyltransferase [Caulobacter sp.]